MNINVIGLGKLGYPMSLFLSSSGYKVNCYDKNITIYEKIKNSNYLNKEENISDYAEYNKNLFYFDNVQDSFKNTFVSFITVPTPSKLDGSFNLDIVKESLDDLGLYLQNNSSNNSPYIINICSTVSPYSCENELIPYMEDKFNLKEGIDFVLVYNPYFVALGSVIKTLRNPDFILVGTRDEKKIKKFLDLYKILYSYEAKFKILSLTEAEITKVCVNTFLTLKISFANIIQLLGFKDKNLSTNKILDAIGEDSRIGKKFLKSGLPYGGPCLPRDNFAVINFLNKLKIQSDLNESSEAINNNYTSYLYDQIDFLEEKNIKKITFMGMGYKSNTDCAEGSV